MIAAIYSRKSTEQNAVADEQRSVVRQVEHARSYAQRKGWTVGDEHVYVDDGISGAEFSNRPGFARLMSALKPRPPFQVLIMSEESRLGRESTETFPALKQIMAAGVRVFTYLEDREVLLGTLADNTMTFLRAEFAAEERRKASQRVMDAMARKARAGHVVGGYCFGYENFCSGCGRTIIPGTVRCCREAHTRRRIHQDEAAIVRRIFELCAAGDGFKGNREAVQRRRGLSATAETRTRARLVAVECAGGALPRQL